MAADEDDGETFISFETENGKVEGVKMSDFDAVTRRLRDKAAGQITLEVDVHEDLADVEEPYIVGSIGVQGSLVLPRDLTPGEHLTVQIADADGVVLAAGRARATQPHFKDIKDRGSVIGTERAHQAAIQ